MTLASTMTGSPQQRILLEDVSWGLYEHLLREVGNRSLRITYDQGRLEIMSPLPEHERWGARIGRLLELLAPELDIALTPLGSTTFRDPLKEKGLEPDECYYVANWQAGQAMTGAFDPAEHPPPDLAIEIDITRSSLDRQPIYAELGVPELWRFDGQKLSVLRLSGGRYVEQDSSAAFPMLPIKQLEQHLARFGSENDTKVVREFQAWVRTLQQ